MFQLASALLAWLMLAAESVRVGTILAHPSGVILMSGDIRWCLVWEVGRMRYKNSGGMGCET